MINNKIQCAINTTEIIDKNIALQKMNDRDLQKAWGLFPNLRAFGPTSVESLIPYQSSGIPQGHSQRTSWEIFQKCCFHPDILCLQKASALQVQFPCQNKEMKLILHDWPLLNSRWLQMITFPLQGSIKHPLASRFFLDSCHGSSCQVCCWGRHFTSSLHRKCYIRVFTWTACFTEITTT